MIRKTQRWLRHNLKLKGVWCDMFLSYEKGSVSSKSIFGFYVLLLIPFFKNFIRRLFFLSNIFILYWIISYIIISYFIKQLCFLFTNFVFIRNLIFILLNNSVFNLPVVIWFFNVWYTLKGFHISVLIRARGGIYLGVTDLVVSFVVTHLQAFSCSECVGLLACLDAEFTWGGYYMYFQVTRFYLQCRFLCYR